MTQRAAWKVKKYAKRWHEKRCTPVKSEKLNFPIGLGTGGFSGDGAGYSFGNTSDEQVQRTLNHALDQGIELIDSAPIYGFGLAEKRIGNSLKQRRESCFLMSKCGVTWHDNKRVDLNNDPKICQKMLEQSLRDFKTDIIDAYFIHHPDPRTDIRKSMEVLAKAKDQNKIRYIGLSNTNLDEIHLASEVAGIDFFQEKHSYFDQSFANMMDNDFAEGASQNLIGYGTLEQGLLTQRVIKGRKFEPYDYRKTSASWKGKDLNKIYEKVEKLKAAGEELGHSLCEIALAASTDHKNINFALIGMKTSGDVDSILESYRNRPTPGVLKKIRDRIGDE